MLVGVREVADLVFKAKSDLKLGNTCYKAGMPIWYFETAKTSSLEGAAATVYATGGKGNPQLIAWEGDKTLQLTFEEALISPVSFAILSGAGLIEATETKPIYVHSYIDVLVDNTGSISLPGVEIDTGHGGDCYVMKLDSNGEITGTPIKATVEVTDGSSTVSATGVEKDQLVRIDFYQKKTQKATEISIDADKFAGFYYIEASTLFRKQETGEDVPAEIVIPNAKVQSAWTFSMSNSGDPSTFTFTVDCFPGYTKFDPTKKVLAIMQVIDEPTTSGGGCEGE